jgi:hypothetical protein
MRASQAAMTYSSVSFLRSKPDDCDLLSSAVEFTSTLLGPSTKDSAGLLVALLAALSWLAALSEQPALN